jgi:hypothetical protein
MKYVVTLQGARKVRRVVEATGQADADQQGRGLAETEGLEFKRADPDMTIGDREPTTGGDIRDF